jgi:hypothetical protein
VAAINVGPGAGLQGPMVRTNGMLPTAAHIQKCRGARPSRRQPVRQCAPGWRPQGGEGTYDQHLAGMRWLPLLLVGLSALVLVGVIGLWTREVFGWWRWRMRNYDWWCRKRK